MKLSINIILFCFIILFSKTRAQEVKINKSKIGYQLFSKSQNLESKTYDTLFYIPIHKDPNTHFAAEVKPTSGVYIGVKNWKKTYRQFIVQKEADWFWGKTYAYKPIFDNAKFDLYSAKGQLINKSALAENVYLLFGFEKFIPLVDTTLYVSNLLCEKDSLTAGYSHLILKINGKYEAYDFLGMPLFSAPSDTIFYPYESVYDSKIDYAYVNSSKYGFVNSYNNSVIPASYDTLLLMQMISNPKNAFKHVPHLEKPLPATDGIYQERLDYFYLGIKNGKYKDTIDKVLKSWYRDTIFGDSLIAIKTKKFISGGIDIYNQDLKKINPETYDNINSIDITEDIWLNRKKLADYGIKNMSLRSFQIGKTSAFMVEKDKKWGLINRQEKLALPCDFERFSFFHTNKRNYLVAFNQGNSQLFTLEGESISPEKYDSIWFYNRPDSCFATVNTLKRPNNEFAFVKKDSKMGVISITNGKIIVPINFDNIWYDPLTSQFVVHVGTKNQIIQIDTVYDYQMNFKSEKFNLNQIHIKYKIRVPKSGKYGVYKLNGELAVDVKYDFVVPEKEGYTVYSSVKMLPEKCFIPFSQGYFFNPDNDFVTYKRLLKLRKGKPQSIK